MTKFSSFYAEHILIPVSISWPDATRSKRLCRLSRVRRSKYPTNRQKIWGKTYQHLSLLAIAYTTGFFARN